MIPRQKISNTLRALFYTSLFFAATVAARAQTTTTETERGNATVSTSQVEGEVVQVEGNDLLVKLTTGEMRTFRVPETRKFVIDGKELSVHDLQPGTKLSATVKTTTTPLTVRTISRISGRVWYVAGPNVILTMPDGKNKQFVVKDTDNVRFMIGDRQATVFDLRKGMTVVAEKLVEEPSMEITADTTVVGHASAAPVEAAAPMPAPQPAPEPAAAQPAEPQTAAPQTAAPPAAAPETATPQTPEPQTAAPETAAPTAPPPAAPAAEGSSTSPLLWVVLLGVLVVVVVFLIRKFRA